VMLIIDFEQTIMLARARCEAATLGAAAVARDAAEEAHAQRVQQRFDLRQLAGEVVLVETRPAFRAPRRWRTPPSAAAS